MDPSIPFDPLPDSAVYSTTDVGKLEKLELNELSNIYDHTYSGVNDGFLDSSIFQSSPLDMYIMDTPSIYTSKSLLASESGDSIRRKVNPLYQASPDKKPVPSQRDKHQSGGDSCICCLIVLVLLFLITAIAALAISLYLLLSQHLLAGASINDRNNVSISTAMTPTSGNIKDNTWKDINNIVLELRREMMKLQLASQKFADFKMEISNIQDNMTTLEEIMQNKTLMLESNVIDFKESIEDQFVNISKLSGPKGDRGPIGTTAFSLCFYMPYIEARETRLTSSHLTLWSPTIHILKNFTVMAAGCSVEGGSSYNLETRLEPQVLERQYRCLCSGKTPSAKLRVCTNHLWICPRM